MRISQHWDLHVLFLERKPASEGLKAGRRIRAQNIQCPEYPMAQEEFLQSLERAQKRPVETVGPQGLQNPGTAVFAKYINNTN